MRKLRIFLRLLTFLLIIINFISLLCHGKVFNGIIEEKKDNQEKEDIRSMFPHDFLFGTSTSAYQIEGAYLEDGKGLSNWDVFTHIPGNVPNNENGDISDDHYHRYMEDIENTETLRVNSYRFSISWSRILPKGRFGKVNPAGITFYNSIIDNLLLRGIVPFVTLCHNDIPQELEDRYGSWLSPHIQEDFVEYARICFEEFGDRVKHWSTINEPNVYNTMAYKLGSFPPKHCSPPFGNCSNGNSDLEPLIAGHNMILSHAKVVQLYRHQFQAKQLGNIGIVIHAYNYEPYKDDSFSLQAVERSFAFDGLTWFLDPLIYGEYPKEMRKYLGKDLPKFSKEEEKLVKGSVDFIGINHYSSLYSIDCLTYPVDCTSAENRAISGFVRKTGYRDGTPIGDETGLKSFYVVPSGLEKIMDYIRLRYPDITIYITENGITLKEGAIIEDFKRIHFHRSYLKALARAMRKGAKVKGYFVWSLMDNFEWFVGYDATFGLYYVDRNTLDRSPKLSAKWYSEFLTNHTQFYAPKSTLKSFITKISFNTKRRKTLK